MTIQINALTITYNNVPLLWNAHATIPAGSMTAIIGANGAGKSTLMRAMIGLVEPMAGSITVGSTPFQADDYAYVPQRSNIDWDFPLHVIDVVIMGCYKRLGWFKKPCKQEYEKAHRAIDQVGMLSYMHTPINQLSGGQQQRVWMARALLQDASYYLLDEPFNAIDEQTQHVLLALFKQLCDQGKTIIVIHHDLEMVRAHFDWALLVHGGSIISGNPHELIASHSLRHHDIPVASQTSGF